MQLRQRTQNSMTKVSIIIPAFNCEKYIQKAIDSISSQTYSDWEAIIVNDGSTDTTKQICDEWCRRESRSRVIHQENSGGPSTPRNRAINESNGQYIAFLDPDDIWHNEKLEAQVKIMNENPDLALLFDDSTLIDEHDNIIGSYFNSLEFLEKSTPHTITQSPSLRTTLPSFLYFSSCVYTGIQTSGVMTRRNIVNELDYIFPADLRNCEDNDLWWRIMKKGTIAFTTNSYHYYRSHNNGLSRDPRKLLEGQILAHSRNYFRHKDEFPPTWEKAYRQRIAEHYTHLAWNEKLAKNLQASLTAHINSFQWLPNLRTGFSILKTLALRATHGFQK